MEPEARTEYAAHPAIRVNLVDLAGTSKLTCFLHQQTLQLLGSFVA
jgi:hypothetical protein